MLSHELLTQVVRSGFDQPEQLLHLFVGGSELHGAKVGSTDDLDVYGVFVEAPEQALGLLSREHFVWSTASDARRNGPNDVDVTLYSLKKWARLAVRGNATALHFLFADTTASSEPVWVDLQSRSNAFLSKRSAQQFSGFAANQLRRIIGERGRGSKGHRPEYECAYGYDTKAAMHCLRLLYECIELMQSGRITLPRPERELLVEVRSGDWPLERFLSAASALQMRCEEATEESNLPDQVDAEEISTLIADTHIAWWRQQGLL